MKRAAQPVQLRLIKGFFVRCRRLGSPIKRSERGVELAGYRMGFCFKAQPHGVDTLSAGLAPVGKAGVLRRYGLVTLAQASERDTPAHCSDDEPMSKAMLARDRDRR